MVMENIFLEDLVFCHVVRNCSSFLGMCVMTVIIRQHQNAILSQINPIRPYIFHLREEELGQKCSNGSIVHE